MSTPEATYCGQHANIGRVTPRPVHQGEGYAVLRCGGTEVVLSYTLLHHIILDLDHNDILWDELVKAQKAIQSITCEAGLGRNGETNQAAPELLEALKEVYEDGLKTNTKEWKIKTASAISKAEGKQ